MLTLNEIQNISFRQAKKGYQPEDVDTFIDDVAESYDLLIKKGMEQKKQIEELTAEKAQLEQTIQQLKNAQKTVTQPSKQTVENVKLSEECEYTQEEIKNALLSAQKLANATIREARQKAEALLNDANSKAERIVSAAQGEVNEQKDELERLKKLVADFRTSLLDKYKEHLKMVNALPSGKAAERAEASKTVSGDTQPVAVPNLNSTMGKEAMSRTRSFQLGGNDTTGEFSELKFGADYDITKE